MDSNTKTQWLMRACIRDHFSLHTLICAHHVSTFAVVFCIVSVLQTRGRSLDSLALSGIIRGYPFQFFDVLFQNASAPICVLCQIPSNEDLILFLCASYSAFNASKSERTSFILIAFREMIGKNEEIDCFNERRELSSLSTLEQR